MQTYKTYKTTPGDVKNTSTGADQQRSYCSLLTSQRVHGGRWKAMDYFNYEGKQFILISNSLADLGGGVRDARPPLGVQILSISCSFRENLACSRPPWRVHAPPSGKSWIRHCNYFSKFHYFQSKNIMVLIKGLSN